MRFLEQLDYLKIFLKARQYNNSGQISDYFEGLHNQYKECNSFKLFVDGLNKAYLLLKEPITRRFNKEYYTYSLAKGFNPSKDYYKPDISDFQEPAYQYDGESPYNLEQIDFIKSGLDNFIHYTEQKESEKNSHQNIKRTKVSYHWQGKTDELTELYHKMIDTKLIALDTSEADFKAIFEAKPLDEVKPINWINSDALLAYFIDSLMEKIAFSDNYNKWKIAEACFNPGKNLKNQANNYKNNKTGKPKHHHLVDELF